MFAYRWLPSIIDNLVHYTWLMDVDGTCFADGCWLTTWRRYIDGQYRLMMLDSSGWLVLLNSIDRLCKSNIISSSELCLHNYESWWQTMEKGAKNYGWWRDGNYGDSAWFKRVMISTVMLLRETWLEKNIVLFNSRLGTARPWSCINRRFIKITFSHDIIVIWDP